MFSARMRLPFVLAAMIVLVAACGGDGDGGDTTDAAGDTTSGGGAENQAAASSGGGGGGGGGTLTLGEDVINLDSARCFLEEQDVAGSAGKILFNGQGFGTTGAGETFVLDVSRYDEDSMFTGDDIGVDIGDPRGDDFYSWSGKADLGTIERDGSTLRADGLTFRHSKDFTEVAGAFELNC